MKITKGAAGRIVRINSTPNRPECSSVAEQQLKIFFVHKHANKKFREPNVKDYPLSSGWSLVRIQPGMPKATSSSVAEHLYPLLKHARIRLRGPTMKDYQYLENWMSP